MRPLALLAAAALASTATAQTVDTDAAQAIARQFFTAHATGPNRAPAKIAPVLSYTATTEGTPDFYVFNRGADAPGFVIINAADAETSILGYSETATFDYETAPANFRWWLQQYQQNGVAKAPAKAGAARHSIPELITTKWNQTPPFSNAIAQAVGNYGFVTGCTATAMAQIMKFHEHPTRGTGSKSYTIGYNSGTLPLTFQANFGATTYDWANMIDDYSGSYTPAQANAVATLMYHAGVAEETTYRSANSGGSSADDRESAMALVRNFGYDASMLRAQREYYTDADWEDLIYNELAAGRPILYAGNASPEEGHAFVCHGYDAVNDLYAINWGWGGLSDGYYALTGKGALNPDDQGAGGSSSGIGFVNSQSVTYNIHPDNGGSAVMQVGNYADGNLSTTKKGTAISNYNLNRASSSDRTLYYTYCPCNPGLCDARFQYGVMLRNVANGNTYVTEPYSSTNNLQGEYLEPSGYYTDTFDIPFSTILIPYNGIYEVLPAYRDIDGSGPWHEAFHLVANGPAPTITVTGGTNPPRVELPISISADVVQVGNTISITHNPYYTGTISYTSSDPAVASIDANGTVLGHRIGSATITASATADANFNATEVNFDIKVVEHIVRNVQFSLSDKSILKGNTATLTAKQPYDGTTTITASPAGIVSIAPDGTITGLREGATMLTIHADATYDFAEAEACFPFYVGVKPANTGQFDFADYLVCGNFNTVSPTEGSISMNLVNHSSTTKADKLYYYLDIGSGYYPVTDGVEFPELEKNEECGFNLDLSSLHAALIPGQFYTIYFYRGAGRTLPMNIPSLTFRCVSATPAIGELNKVIEQLNHTTSGSLFDVEYLKTQILCK